jgi:hypothetical protein
MLGCLPHSYQNTIHSISKKNPHKNHKHQNTLPIPQNNTINNKLYLFPLFYCLAVFLRSLHVSEIMTSFILILILIISRR